MSNAHALQCVCRKVLESFKIFFSFNGVFNCPGELYLMDLNSGKIRLWITVILSVMFQNVHVIVQVRIFHVLLLQMCCILVLSYKWILLYAFILYLMLPFPPQYCHVFMVFCNIFVCISALCFRCCTLLGAGGVWLCHNKVFLLLLLLQFFPSKASHVIQPS